MELAAALAQQGTRALRDEDAAFVTQLYASTRTDLGGGDSPFTAGLIAMQQRLQAADYRARYPNASYWIVEQAGTPAGRLVLDLDGARLRVVDIAVLPAARCQGLGTALLETMSDWALARGLALTLSVHHRNPRARALYARLGFAVSGTDQYATHLFISPEKLPPKV